MPRASKHRVSKSVFMELQDNFAFLISSLSSSQDIQQFFTRFLTREEKIMLTKRLMLHLMIESGYDPTEISSILHLSRETIYKHKTLYDAGDSAYKAIIISIARRKKVKAFWKKVEKILRPLSLAIDSQNNMKSRAKFLSGDYD